MKMNGVLALVICSIMWSFGGIFIKNVQWNGIAIAGMRSLIAGIFMCTVNRRLLRFHGQNRYQTFFLWTGALCYSLTMILFVSANKLTTSANAILLQYTSPLYVILFSPLILGEKNRRSDYFTVIGVMAGIFLFFADGLETGNMLGNILAALSGLTYAFSSICFRKSPEVSDDAMALSHFITALVTLPWMIVSGMPDARSWIFLMLAGMVAIGFPSILFTYGLKTVRALTASFITMCEPLMNPVWVILFAGEIPSVKCVLGGVMILGFIMIRSVIQSLHQTKQPVEE